MKQLHIKEKLEQIGIDLESVPLGDFDRIGEFTAKRDRSPGSEHYNSAGAFYRSNYERGILIYYLIRKFNISSMLEIGFGRGYSTLCAAKAFHDAGIPGKITTIDPNFDEQFIKALGQIFPREWFAMINFVPGSSEAVYKSGHLQDKYDFVYIDGDHSYEGTKLDWEACKDKFEKFLLFDDYHLPTKDDPGIQCSQLIDQIEDDSKELIIMDRRIFVDERKLPDEKVDYGQVLLTRDGVADDEW
jgi:hypothetical protein